MDIAGKLDPTQLLPVVRKSMNDFAAALHVGERPVICTDTFCAGLASFLTLLAQTNEVMNLTSDADPGHLLATHIRDSLAPLLVGLESPHLLLDIGTVLQYALPLLASNGRLVLWKGEKDLAELQDPPFVATLHRVHCTATILDYTLPGVERNSKLVILQVTPTLSGRSSRRNGS